MLYAYCMSVLYRFRHLKKIIGIASEPPPKPGDHELLSEDMIMIEAPTEWSQELVAELDQWCKGMDIMREDRTRRRNFHATEYPEEPGRSTS